VPNQTTLLFRPVGPAELELLRAAEWRWWPPRLPEQPIFYPVTNFRYAAEIASRWNVDESGAGYVTRFRVRTTFMQRFPVQTVGAARHTEWWVPAEDLDELNGNIVGPIEVIASFGRVSLAQSDTPTLSRVETVGGDLLEQEVDAIVNAWNRNFIPWWLLLPQGISGSIKRAAGTKPFRELRKYGLLRAGDAVVTGAGRLSYRGIIHVAGLSALWRSSERIVRRCVRSALAVATHRGFTSVAFPLIGAGTGGLDRDVVREAMLDEISRSSFNGRVVVVLFSGASPIES
jgi:O-acetyl-ADP-ribose deacetylase (regulator of RNase III)